MGENEIIRFYKPFNRIALYVIGSHDKRFCNESCKKLQIYLSWLKRQTKNKTNKKKKKKQKKKNNKKQKLSERCRKQSRISTVYSIFMYWLMLHIDGISSPYFETCFWHIGSWVEIIYDYCIFVWRMFEMGSYRICRQQRPVSMHMRSSATRLSAYRINGYCSIFKNQRWSYAAQNYWIMTIFLQPV